jgi:hypothetical protein
MKIMGNHRSAQSIQSRKIIFPPLIRPKKLEITTKGKINSMIAIKRIKAYTL